jgi:aryl-alcohol dehydrogenase-like predicted oxidoreductase
VRASQLWVEYFRDGRPAPEWLARLDAIRAVLSGGGRTPAQGALCWLLARSPRALPIPGIRTVAQAGQNAAAMSFGPLRDDEMAEIGRLLGR